MSVTRSASTAVEWSKIYTGLGLGKETTTQLQAFRARHSSALNKNAALTANATEIDLSHYRSILKDQSAVQHAEKILRDFKPVDYDVKKWDQVVDSFQGKAVQQAKETVQKISTEEKSLNETLANIKEARPFEELTVTEVAAARPEIAKAVETMIKKGKWTVPGYREKFGEFSLM